MASHVNKELEALQTERAKVNRKFARDEYTFAEKQELIKDIDAEIADLQTFCDQVPDSVASTVVKYIEEDNLREVVKAIP